jgi:hypothetical protein
MHHTDGTVHLPAVLTGCDLVSDNAVAGGMALEANEVMMIQEDVVLAVLYELLTN